MSPSATKTASSPRFGERRRGSAAPRAVRGNSASPITIPATKTARKPEPCETAASAVDRRRRRAAPRAGRASRRAAAARRSSLQQHDAGDGADREPDAHLPQELPARRRRRRRRVHGRELDHPDHQRDPDRVVEPRLALEDRARAALDLLAGEHRERHRRVGRRERGADQERDGPVEAEQVVGRDGDERRGGERADDAEDRDRHGGGAEPLQADAHAAVEEDRDQRERRDPLDVLEREQAREPVGELGGDRGDDQEQRRRREADPATATTRTRIAIESAPATTRMMPPEVEDVVHAPILPVRRRRRAAAGALTDSLRASHCRLMPPTDTDARMRLAASHPARPRTVRRRGERVGRARAGRLALEVEGGRGHGPDHRQGRARRPHGEGVARDRRPQRRTTSGARASTASRAARP